MDRLEVETWLLVVVRGVGDGVGCWYSGGPDAETTAQGFEVGVPDFQPSAI